MSDNRFDLEEGGGGLDGFTGKVEEAYFGENEYGCSLMIKSKFADPENYVRYEDGTYTQYFPCGKGWTTQDGGDTATHEGGDTKRFNKSTKVGMLVSAIANIDGIGDALPADWSAYTSKSWQGLDLTWGRVPVEKRRPAKDADGVETGQWESYQDTMLLPVALAGQAVPSANGQGTLLDITNLALSDDQTNALQSLATSSATDAKFIEGATKIDGVMMNKQFMAALAADVTALRLAFAEPF